MARWTFRKAITRGPFRVSLSRRGAGVSIGFGPFRIGRGADGRTRLTTRVGPLHRTDTIPRRGR